MKKIIIVEKDRAYRTQLGRHLISLGAIPFAFEVPEDFNHELEGVEIFPTKAQPEQESFKTKFADVAKWITEYRGNFEFYVSLQDQFFRKGTLSEKQIDCVRRAIVKQGGAVSSEPVRDFSLKAGTTLIVGKKIANSIAKQTGHIRAHFAFEVLSVEFETQKAWRVKVKMAAVACGHCSVCGLVLENPESIAAGVGPVCADNYGIPYGVGAVSKLKEKLSDVEVETWIPKASIKFQVPEGDKENIAEENIAECDDAFDRKMGL